MNLVIFTQTYPAASSPEQTFIGKELPYLSQCFEKVILIPQKISEKELPLPKNVTTDIQFSTFYQKQGILGSIIHAFFSSHLYKELRQRPSIFLHPQMFLRLIKFVGDAELTKKWTINWLKEEGINTKDTLFYSFWFTQIAMGLGLLKEKYPNMKIIARAHGYDIYEERYAPPYWPCRVQNLKQIDKLFLASAHAHHYMQERYPEFLLKYETAYLGVEFPGFISEKSKDGVLRIISCSSIIPLKRVELLAQAIESAIQIRPKQKIQWIHFGDGRNRKKVQSIINDFPSSVKGILQGAVPNAFILEHYKHHLVDIFVNLSTTEGGSPVSIQEAISCGIPIIATNVGGNPEIVSEKNGILLKKNPTPEEVARAFFEIIDNPDLALEKRKGSLNVWNERYNASKNFDNFARELVDIMSVKDDNNS